MLAQRRVDAAGNLATWVMTSVGILF